MNLIKNLFKSEKQIIQEIHDSFDGAQDELLKQAISIIEQHKPELNDKAERLEKLGFIQSKSVVSNIESRKALISSKKDADLVNYYKTSYPFLKFLKEEQLDTICEKYNLIYAPVDRYKEDVPEKNVAEIENAQPLNKTDEIQRVYRFTNRYDFEENKYNQVIDFLGKSVFEEDELKELIDQYKLGNNAINDIEGFIYWFSKKTDIVSYVFGNCEVIDKSGLFIAAPKSHFDLKGLKKNKLGFFKVKEVKDPIVFRYVKGGIQVLSKWGLEAYDDVLQHEILN